MVWLAGNVYVFGGFESQVPLVASEVYSIVVNVWTELPDLPFNMSCAYAALHLSEIYIASDNQSEIVRFDYKKRIYSRLDILLPLGNKIIISHELTLYILI